MESIQQQYDKKSVENLKGRKTEDLKEEENQSSKTMVSFGKWIGDIILLRKLRSIKFISHKQIMDWIIMTPLLNSVNTLLLFCMTI